MTRFMIRVSMLALITLCVGASLSAAPKLRLRMPGTLPSENPFDRPVWVTSGTNGPTDLAFHAYNGGDGALDVQASGSAPWLTPQVDAAAPCPFDGAISCRRIRVLLQTGALAGGTYEGTVTVTATAAIDAPQTVAVKIYVGGNVPSEIHLYVPPTVGASDVIIFNTPGKSGMSPTNVAPAGSFLSVSDNHGGSFRNVYDHRIAGTYQGGGAGDQPGTVTVSGSSFASDNGPVPVTLHVTASPIGAVSQQQVTINAADGLAPADAVVVVSNRGSGSLAVADVTAAADDAGTWLSTTDLGNNTYGIQAAVDGLAAGLYEGTVTINSNAANSPHVVRVALHLATRSGPISFYRGAVNGANFETYRPLSPGVIASAFGMQMSDAAAGAPSVPLPKEMEGTKVLIDGIEAPLFFVSYGQVNFQVPYEVAAGERTLSVIRDGQAGNEISIQVAPLSAGIFRLGIGEYGAVRNATLNNFPFPASFQQQYSIPASPARPDDVLEIYATGLGPLSRTVVRGAGAPNAEPLARALTDIKVIFSNPNPNNFGRTPQFIGLSPNFVGLFQVNVAVPSSASPNARTPIYLDVPAAGLSNRVEIAIKAIQ
ncbi:MAG: hypothetical protein O3A53_10875 [Acidobacteria bacterium]|nr:hypothetical protein [Acidobacteriota bacterium]